MPASYSYDQWGRPTGVPSRPAMPGRPAVPAMPARTCQFPTEGIATIPREEEEAVSEFDQLLDEIFAGTGDFEEDEI